MKRVLTVAAVLLLCLLIAVPVAAANGIAAQSPVFEPKLKTANLSGLELDGCVVITSVEEAEEKTTDITQEERDLLLEVYQGLVDGTVSLPIEGEYAVREIVDISFKYEDCRALESHGHKDEILKQEGVSLTIDFDMGVGEDEKVCVMTYIDGQWADIEDVVNNGDGSVTCVFEALCPVAFAVVS